MVLQLVGAAAAAAMPPWTRGGRNYMVTAPQMPGKGTPFCLPSKVYRDATQSVGHVGQGSRQGK